MHHPEFPTIAFLCATLILLPLPWHWRAANVATLSIIVWLFVLNVIYGVDAVIWANNAEIVIPVWCDITTKIIVGGNFALPAACLCICIHLEQVSSLRAARTTLPEKRRRQIIEALMCFGLPAVFMALHYIVQGHRFDIIEDFGCRPAIYASVPALILMWVVPLFLATLALGFAGCALMHFIQRRASFAKHLNSQAGLTTARYLRLIMMAVVEMVIGIAFTGYTVWFNSANLQSWTGWADVHWHFSQIAQYPTILLPQMFLRTYTVLWWMVPVATLTFVAFFAFGEDAVNEYKACFSWIASKILRLKPRRLSAKSRHTSSLPVAWQPMTSASTVSMPKPAPVSLSASASLSMVYASQDSSTYKVHCYPSSTTASLYSSATHPGAEDTLEDASIAQSSPILSSSPQSVLHSHFTKYAPRPQAEPQALHDLSDRFDEKPCP